MPPSYRWTNSSCCSVKAGGGERVLAVCFHHDAETRDRMTHKIYSDTYQLNVSRISWRGLLAGLGNRAME
jgi:hypothetical protein